MIQYKIKTLLCFFVSVFGLLTATAQHGNEKQSLKEQELNLHNNEVITISQLKNKVVLLDFWYMSCPPCLRAIPDLIKLQEEFKDNLVIIGINDKNPQEQIAEYLKYKKANYLSTYKTGNDISKNLTIQAFPTTILFDRQGNVIQVDTGYSKAGMRKLRKLIKAAL